MNGVQQSIGPSGDEVKTTWYDVANKKCTYRNYDTCGYHYQHGRSFVVIVCPFCNETVRAYLWSITGSGKRCDCGALLGSLGLAYRLKEPKLKKGKRA